MKFGGSGKNQDKPPPPTLPIPLQSAGRSPTTWADRHHGKVASKTPLLTAELSARSARQTRSPSPGRLVGARGGSRSWVVLLVTALMFAPLPTIVGDPRPLAVALHQIAISYVNSRTYHG